MPRGKKIVDPLALKAAVPKDMILSASAQLVGTGRRQEDSIATFSTECFALADGVSLQSHGDEAARLATETAIWGYKHIRLRPFYWADKKLFIRRIFRSVNITIWQKKREPGFEDGMATTLLVLMVGSRTIWFGSVGDSMGYFVHGSEVSVLNTQDRDAKGNLIKALGVDRYGLIPQFQTRPFEIGDSVILVTDGISDVVEGSIYANFLAHASTQSELEEGVQKILALATERGGKGNMSVGVVKRVPVDRANIG